MLHSEADSQKKLNYFGDFNDSRQQFDQGKFKASRETFKMF